MKKQILFSLLLAAASSVSAQVKINVGTPDGARQVSPMLYGIFFEDINRAADGGLYAELVANRSFEDNAAKPERWSVTGAATMQLIQKDLLNAAQKNALRVNFVGSEAKSGKRPQHNNGVVEGRLVNDGYWGIHAVQGRIYRLSFWAKGKLNAPLKAKLVNADGDVLAETTIDGKLTGSWRKYTSQLTAQASDAKAKLVLATEGKGTVDFDMVSLFPPTFKNRENGCRTELAELLYAMRPKFMRFPGGCFVEGQESPDNAFHWLRTVGPIENRPGHLNRNWSYYTSDGLGFHEFLQLSEDLGAKPLYVVNIGLWHGGMTPVDSLQPWIDECMDALEYANGPVTSKYGAMRAANGHPEPFNIEYLEIGNENNQDDPRQQSDRYYDRYRKFKDAVLAKYPKMHLIGNVVAWGNDHPKWKSTEQVELLDEHYYRTPGWFADNFHKYDSYDRRGPKIYCGEYAVTNGFGKIGNLNAALGEAVFMMGMENNSDVVEMSSYAPIFVNENNVCWQPDMIRYNASQVMCTPSYYVQKLMAEHVGTRILKVRQDNPYRMVSPSAVAPARCHVGYATWGTAASFQTLGVEGAVANADKKDEYQVVKGDWKKRADIVSQDSKGEACIATTAPEYNAAAGYTYQLRARKDGGAEGFMIVFNYKDPQNYCWVNLGGWGNKNHAIEQVIDGGKIQTEIKPGSVTEGSWYNITLTVKGENVKCWLNDELVFDTKLKSPTNYGIYSSATYDEPTGETIVKVVNTSNVATTADIQLDGGKITQAHAVRLASGKGTDENTLNNPTNVSPTEQTLFPTAEGKLQMEVKPFSLNIIRMK